MAGRQRKSGPDLSICEGPSSHKVGEACAFSSPASSTTSTFNQVDGGGAWHVGRDVFSDSGGGLGAGVSPMTHSGYGTLAGVAGWMEPST